MQKISAAVVVIAVAVVGGHAQASATEPISWLEAVNAHRAVQDASLPAIAENSDWSNGDFLHSRYIVETGQFGHTEDENNPWYTPEGAAAGQKGNVASCGSDDRQTVEIWVTAPFHQVGILDPQLRASGFGKYTRGSCAATLDVIRGLSGPVPAADDAPQVFPGNGSATSLTSYNGAEYPDPMTSCSFSSASAPMLFQFPAKGAVSAVSLVRDDGKHIETCSFDGTTYVNPDATEQSLGRSVLSSRGAVVVFGRGAFEAGRHYTASVTAGDITATTHFLVTCGELAAKRSAGVHIVTGVGRGACPYVRTFFAPGVSSGPGAFPYAASFRGGVRVASGDVNGDHVPDVIAAAGPGGGPHVVVFDGATGAVIRSFMAYASTFTGGVTVASADVNQDGYFDIVTGAGAGGGPHVLVIDGKGGTVIRSFMAYSPAFRGGVRVAAADVTGDRVPDVVTGPGGGGGPHVQAFDGATGAVVRSFMAYAPTFTGGVDVAAGRLNGDEVADIVTAPGAGGGPHVQAFDGATGTVLLSFMAYAPSFTGGVHVAVGDLSNDGPRGVVTGPGAGGGPHVRSFDASGSVVADDFAYLSSMSAGVEVALAPSLAV